MGDVPVKLAIGMGPEMCGSEVGGRNRQRFRGGTVAAGIGTMAGNAVCSEQFGAVRDGGGGEFGGRGEEARWVGLDEQQIEVGKREGQDDKPECQRDPAKPTPQDGGDDERDGDRDTAGCGDDFGAWLRRLRSGRRSGPAEIKPA